VPFQAATSVIASTVANMLLPYTQIAPRTFPMDKTYGARANKQTTSSASPFWRTTSNSSNSAAQSKKVIGAAYSHADILNFSSLYGMTLHSTAHSLLTSKGASPEAIRDLEPHHPPLIAVNRVLHQVGTPPRPALPDLPIVASCGIRIMTGMRMKWTKGTCSRTMKTSSACLA
jgi:hypothetical protein